MEKPRYDDIDSMIRRNKPETAGQESADSLKKFCDSVEIILHTVNDNEREAVLDLLDRPDLEVQCPPGKPVNLSAIERIVLGMFGGYRCGLIQTGMGEECSEEVKEALQKFPQAKFILAIGVAYALNPEKAKLGDVLFSKKVYAFGNVKASAGRIYPRDDSLSLYDISKKLSQAFTYQEKRWPAEVAFGCTKIEGGLFRTSKIHCGSFLSWEALIDDKIVRDQLRERYNEAIGGEMEGAQLAKIVKDLEKTGRKIDFAVIKGVADFADGEKKKDWQLTAAMAAASFTKFCLNETRGELTAGQTAVVSPPMSTGPSGSSSLPSGNIKIWKKTPDEFDAFRLVKKISANWIMLGKNLEVPENERISFNQTLFNDQSKLDRLINYWLSSHCSPPTFENLHKAVTDLGAQGVVQDIEDFVADPKNEAKYIKKRDYVEKGN